MIEHYSDCTWARGIWFTQAMPKYEFMAWLSVRDRLSTLDRIDKWNQGIDATCVLCKAGHESRNHLFFECSYTGQVWEHIVKSIMCNSFTNTWPEIMEILTDSTREKKSLFCIR